MNVILNAQPESQASGYYHLHGISLCAVAWRVRGVARLLQRAQDYGYALWQGETGPNERQIPALCAPDGSLIYLVEADEDPKNDIYHTDFHLTHRSAPPPALQSIDHLAIALTDESCGNWIMFLRSVPGFVQDNEWELPDPLGLVRSRVAQPQRRHPAAAEYVGEPGNPNRPGINHLSGCGITACRLWL